MLSTTVEVKCPCTPTPSGGGSGGVAEVADVLTYNVSTRSPYRSKGIAYDRKNIVLILRYAHCADGVRKLVHELSGVGSRVDLPDLRRVDQCHEDLAVRANSDVLDPLNREIMSAIMNLKITTSSDNNVQCCSKNGRRFGRDHLHCESLMARRCYGKRRDQSKVSRYESTTLWNDLSQEQGSSSLKI